MTCIYLLLLFLIQPSQVSVLYNKVKLILLASQHDFFNFKRNTCSCQILSTMNIYPTSCHTLKNLLAHFFFFIQIKL